MLEEWSKDTAIIEKEQRLQKGKLNADIKRDVSKS